MLKNLAEVANTALSSWQPAAAGSSSMTRKHPSLSALTHSASLLDLLGSSLRQRSSLLCRTSANTPFQSASSSRFMPSPWLFFQNLSISTSPSVSELVNFISHTSNAISAFSNSQLSSAHNLFSLILTPLFSHCFLTTQKGNIAMAVYLCQKGLLP